MRPGRTVTPPWPVRTERLVIRPMSADDVEATSYSSEAPAPEGGSLASDEALQALREKLTGGA